MKHRNAMPASTDYEIVTVPCPLCNGTGWALAPDEDLGSVNIKCPDCR